MRKMRTALSDKDYGSTEEEVEEMPSDVIEAKKADFLSGLHLNKEQIADLEIKTRGQAANPLQRAETSNRLTASSFGLICRKRESTNPQNIIKRILNESFTGLYATDWGRQNEETAKQQFALEHSCVIQECGLYVHKNFGFLGASPDGVIENNAF